MTGSLPQRLKAWALSYWDSLPFVGTVLAALFFAASMTPSLLPRSFITQGLLSGFAAAFGYAVGIAFHGIWRWLQFPHLPLRINRAARWLAVSILTITLVIVLWRACEWQNSIRRLMQMPAVPISYPFLTGILAVMVSLSLLIAGRIFRLMCLYVAMKLKRFVPPRVASLTAIVFVLFVAFTVSNRVIATLLLNAADSSFDRIDQITDEGVQQPEKLARCGSPESLVDWQTIGRRGKNFIVSGPSAQDIAAVFGDDARDPVRVYVGYRTCESAAERAELALKEMLRVGAFERSILVVATPTGTGWVDPNAVDTLEYLHAGDTAIVAIQYSYLPSWLTIMVDPERSKVAARALFNSVYSHWKTLPASDRPRLYLQGLSLGSLGSESSADLLTIFEDPIDGAVFSGPPFPSSQWRSLTDARNEGSPFWRPEIRDGRMVRFANQSGEIANNENWGPIRTVYLQYASDPMVMFSPSLLYARPEWLEPRGPDVSPYLRWVPAVTFLQIAFDLPLATTVPIGFGHNYSPLDYIDAWTSVTAPVRLSGSRIDELKKVFRDRQPESF